MHLLLNNSTSEQNPTQFSTALTDLDEDLAYTSEGEKPRPTALNVWKRSSRICLSPCRCTFQWSNYCAPAGVPQMVQSTLFERPPPLPPRSSVPGVNRLKVASIDCTHRPVEGVGLDRKGEWVKFGCKLVELQCASKSNKQINFRLNFQEFWLLRHSTFFNLKIPKKIWIWRINIKHLVFWNLFLFLRFSQIIKSRKWIHFWNFSIFDCLPNYCLPYREKLYNHSKRSMDIFLSRIVFLK